MNNKSLLYLILILGIILILLISFYFTYRNDLTKRGASSPETQGQSLFLKSEIRGNALDLIILSMSKDKNPAEIIATVDLVPKFLEPPVPTIRKTILIEKETVIVEGLANPTEERVITLNELQNGDNLLAVVAEPVSDVLWREYFTALKIKRTIQE
jgi:hypothetical protein